MGQPRLPVCLPLCGDGSFDRPLALDTRDLLLRTVTATENLRTFVHEPWVEAVAQLNALLRWVRLDFLDVTLPPVLRLLARINTDPDGALRRAGLVVRPA